MEDKPSSPFTGLDKALLRSTQKQTGPPKDAKETAQPQSITTDSQASKLESELASMLASYPDEVIEQIRKTVKFPGKDVSFVRLAPEEKGELADIIYTYKRLGKRTSENEINRIAINFILLDYKANGQSSLLARVIEALLA